MPQRLKPRESSDLDGTTALRPAAADSLRHVTQGRQNDAPPLLDEFLRRRTALPMCQRVAK